MLGYLTLEWIENETAKRIAKKYGRQVRIFAQLLEVMPELKKATVTKINRTLIERYGEKAPCRDSIREYLTMLEKEGLVRIHKRARGWVICWAGGEESGEAVC